MSHRVLAGRIDDDVIGHVTIFDQSEHKVSQEQPHTTTSHPHLVRLFVGHTSLGIVYDL